MLLKSKAAEQSTEENVGEYLHHSKSLWQTTKRQAAKKPFRDAPLNLGCHRLMDAT